jgi:hypothetical protein
LFTFFLYDKLLIESSDRMKEIDKRYDALKAKIEEQEGTQEGAE